jgi:hypothetical protein
MRAVSEGSNPADSLILNFQLSELEENVFLSLRCPVYDALFQQPEQIPEAGHPGVLGLPAWLSGQ